MTTNHIKDEDLYNAMNRGERMNGNNGGYDNEYQYDEDEDDEDDEQKETMSVRMMREESKVPEELPGTLADVVAEQRVFNELGYGVTRVEALRIMIGLRQLIQNEPLGQVRWWGKIRGTLSDYYIAEGKVDETRLNEMGYGENEESEEAPTAGHNSYYYNDDDGIGNEDKANSFSDAYNHGDNDEGDDEDEDDSDARHDAKMAAQIARVLCPHVAAHRKRSTPPEEPNIGVNEFVYFAAISNDPTKWTRLPRVKPHHIVSARQMCNVFTGDLEAPVQSHPRFFGRERHYLRAQIARITHGCKIAPRDIFMTEGAIPESNEDNDENNNDNGNKDNANLLNKRSTRRNEPIMVPAYATLPPLIPRELPDDDTIDNEDDFNNSNNNSNNNSGRGGNNSNHVANDEEYDRDEEDGGESHRRIRVWARGYAHDELLQGKYWVHTSPTLLRLGRVTTPVDHLNSGESEVYSYDDGEQEQMQVAINTAATQHDVGNANNTNALTPPHKLAEESQQQQQQLQRRQELIHPFLSTVADDAPLYFPGHSRASFPSWCFRTAFHNESDRTRYYVARSLRWPGAISYAVTQPGKAGATYQFIYLGNGLKCDQEAAFNPALPPRCMSEFDEAENGMLLQRDCTVDEELAYAPLPPINLQQDQSNSDNDDDDDNNNDDDKEEDGTKGANKSREK